MLHLGYSLTPFGHDPASWQGGSREAMGFDALLQQVLMAERACFDFVWLADSNAERPVDAPSPVATPFEPTTLASALATRAKKIGFVVTAATQQHEPYNLARRFASLDWISHGRGGWAVVAGTSEARDREYVEVVSALLDSWEDDAFIHDKPGSRFFVPEKMHVLNHKGEHFSVRGPLNVNRSPQGKPVLATSGGSSVADSAEVIFIDADDTAPLKGDVRVFRTVKDFGGSPIAFADRLQKAFQAGGIHGFVLAPPTTAALAEFTDAVVPELRKRGLARGEYEGSTLRDYLGLPYPAHPASRGDAA